MVFRRHLVGVHRDKIGRPRDLAPPRCAACTFFAASSVIDWSFSPQWNITGHFACSVAWLGMPPP